MCFFGQLRFQRACLREAPLNYCNRTCNWPNQPIMSSCHPHPVSSSFTVSWETTLYRGQAHQQGVQRLIYLEAMFIFSWKKKAVATQYDGRYQEQIICKYVAATIFILSWGKQLLCSRWGQRQDIRGGWWREICSPSLSRGWWEAPSLNRLGSDAWQAQQWL